MGPLLGGGRPSLPPVPSPQAIFSSETSLFQLTCLSTGGPERDGDSAFSLHPHWALCSLTSHPSPDSTPSLHLLGHNPAHNSPESHCLPFGISACCLTGHQPGSHPSLQTLMSCAALTTLHNLTLWGRPSPAVGTSLRAPPPLPPRLSNLTPNSWALLPHTGHLCPWASACFVFSAESTPPLCQVTLQDSTDVLRLTLGSHSPSALPLIALINMFIL